MERYDIEELVLELADIVTENRYLFAFTKDCE